jgi:matrixin
MHARALVAAALCAAACTGSGNRWDAAAWVASRPELRGRDIGRLADATPYLLPVHDELLFFWCTWPLDGPLRVSLPRDANQYERELLEKALRAWEKVVTGLHFEVIEGNAPIRMRFSNTGPEGARTAVDCELEPPFDGQGPLDARLVSAQIDLRRAERDPWGRPIDLAATELIGSAAHELGHALGLQGHVGGRSVLSRETAEVRKQGERIQNGDELREPAMAAVYSLASGTLLERRKLGQGATAQTDAIAERGVAQGATRVSIRVGDRAAAVRWGTAPDLVYYVNDPAKILDGKLGFEKALAVP